MLTVKALSHCVIAVIEQLGRVHGLSSKEILGVDSDVLRARLSEALTLHSEKFANR